MLANRELRLRGDIISAILFDGRAKDILTNSEIARILVEALGANGMRLDTKHYYSMSEIKLNFEKVLLEIYGSCGDIAWSASIEPVFLQHAE